jgi:uncharacterized membrane protein
VNRAVIAAAAILGIAYAILTPPFNVPDETFHFWRPLVIAHGQLMPQRRGAPDAGTIPLGAQNFVFVMWWQRTPQGKMTRELLRVAAQSPPEIERPKEVRFPTQYTPVPYAPQTIAAMAMYALKLRPFIVFYLGRLLNLAAALALMWMAMRAAPQLAEVIAAVTLLPMTLTLFGSWSPDALTIALATLLTALLLGERAPRAAIAVAVVLSLCKPAYFLIALLVIPGRFRRSMKIAIIAATAIGTAMAMAYLQIGAYAQRMFDPINAGAQMQCFLGDPMRFVRGLGRAVAGNGWIYIEQIAGRAGGDALMNMPLIVVVVELALLVAAALGTMARWRALTAGIVVITILGIFFSQYLVWSIACGEVIEGVQGRYFLPLLTLALTMLALPALKKRIPVAAVLAAAVLCNAIVLIGIARQFWL